MYGLIIIGAGPAGLTAAIYASRARISTLVLEKSSEGGQLLLTESLENYPGFPGGVVSLELIDRLVKQAKEFGAEIKTEETVKIEKNNSSEGGFLVYINENKYYQARAVIIATGARAKRLNIDGEREFLGKGVSYCATCDGPLYRNKDVAVVGGGDSAIEEALFLARFAKKVYIIHRRDKLRATRILEERVNLNPKIEFILDSVVERIIGNEKVGAVSIKNTKTGVSKELLCDGVFIFVGYIPNTDFCKNLVDLNKEGYIITDVDMRTSCDGVFSSGDCRQKSLYQVVTACGDGATATDSVYRYLSGK